MHLRRVHPREQRHHRERLPELTAHDGTHFQSAIAPRLRSPPRRIKPVSWTINFDLPPTMPPAALISVPPTERRGYPDPGGGRGTGSGR
jgi:hypothetical protein